MLWKRRGVLSYNRVGYRSSKESQGGIKVVELKREKVTIPIEECVPGMVLMQPIIDEQTGTTIVSKGQMMTTEMLTRLQNFKHIQVWVSVESMIVAAKEHSIWKVDEKTLQTYKDYAQVLKNFFEEEKEKHTLSIEKLVELSDEMIKEFSDSYKVLACINLLQEMECNQYNHSINVAFMALAIGRWMMFDEVTLKHSVLAALLHDVGKLQLSPMLYHKKENEMSSVEKLEYKRHPIYAYQKLIAYNELDVEVLKGVLTHHERCDGSGYPLALRDEKIGKIAKIIGIADTFEELRSEYNIFKTIKIMGTQMIRKFDVNMLLQFCNTVMNYYVGSTIVLNTGEVGEVVFIQTQALHRPIIKIKGKYINLYEETQLKIEKVIA